MKLQVFSIYDQKLKAHMQPFYQANIEMAQRTFADVVNNPESPFGKHPADYTLIELGSWDDESSRFTNLELPNVLGTGIEYLISTPIRQSDEKTNGQQVSNDTPIQSGSQS